MITKLEVLSYILKAPQTEFEFLGSGSYANVYKYKGLVYKLTSDSHDYAVACKVKGKKNPYIVPIIDTRLVRIKRRNRGDEILYLIVAEERPCLYYNAVDDFSNFVLNNLSAVKMCLNYKNIFKDLKKGISTDEIITKFWESPLPTFYNFHDERMKKMIKEYVALINALYQVGMIFFDFHNENFSIYEGKFVAIDLGHNTTKNPRFSKRRRTVIKTF